MKLPCLLLNLAPDLDSRRRVFCFQGQHNVFTSENHSSVPVKKCYPCPTTLFFGMPLFVLFWLCELRDMVCRRWWSRMPLGAHFSLTSSHPIPTYYPRCFPPMSCRTSDRRERSSSYTASLLLVTSNGRFFAWTQFNSTVPKLIPRKLLILSNLSTEKDQEYNMSVPNDHVAG